MNIADASAADSAATTKAKTKTKVKLEYRRVRLSQAFIDKLTVPPDTRRKIADTRGTGLILEASGPNLRHSDTRKVFKLPMRVDGQQITMTLGRASPALTLVDAERQVTELKFARIQGRDPRGLREPKPVAEAAPKKIDTLGATIDHFVDAYLAERNADGSMKRSAGYRVDCERYLRLFAKSLSPARDITTIERREIREYLTELTKRPVAANRAHAAISTFFGWAAGPDIEILKTSPTVGLKRPGGDEVARDRALTDSEIPLVWRAALALSVPYSQLYRMLLVTGQRLEEVATMRWSDVIEGVEGVDGPVWVISDTKSGRPQTLPLSSLALEILNELPRTGPFVFAGRKGAVSGFGYTKSRLDELIAGICKKEGLETVPHFRNHDLRRSCATMMGRLGVTEFDISRVLNHANRVGETQKYNKHSFDPQKAAALEKLANRLRRLTDTNPPPDNVEQLTDHRAA